MPSGKPVTVADPREFFAAELKSVLEKRRLEAQPDAVHYLTDLMLRYMQSETFFTRTPDGKLEDNVLVHLYSDYLNASPELQKAILRRLGDVCMLVTGFFPDSLKRKVVDIDYYFGMGGAAYWQLSRSRMLGVSPLFEELSVKFKTFSNVINEISEKSGLQSNADLLRVYERWLYSGSDRLREVLASAGIGAPLKVDTTTRH